MISEILNINIRINRSILLPYPVKYSTFFSWLIVLQICFRSSYSSPSLFYYCVLHCKFIIFTPFSRFLSIYFFCVIFFCSLLIALSFSSILPWYFIISFCGILASITISKIITPIHRVFRSPYFVYVFSGVVKDSYPYISIWP